MFLAHVVADAIDTALENREVTLNGICMGISANVFIDRVNDRAVAGELFTDRPIDTALVAF
jgi:hypothetical protein